MKKIVSLLLMLLLLAGMALAGANAESNVLFKGGAENFVFMPGSVFTDSDLFSNFKNVMPGDVITQRIIVKNNSGKKVRIFLRAEPVDEKHAEFLSHLNLQVTSKNEHVFDAAASQTAQLTENVPLGVFKTAGSTELVLTLTVPYDLGNEYMLATGIVPWTFTVEEYIEEDTPHTGDSFDLSTWLLAAGMILAAIVYVLIRMKKDKAASN
ncbi:MAG: hypothetical protein IKL25_08645 [Clostridia bacterium]|nr:hypothetical protein [Clostridia bacterium]